MLLHACELAAPYACKGLKFIGDHSLMCMHGGHSACDQRFSCTGERQLGSTRILLQELDALDRAVQAAADRQKQQDASKQLRLSQTSAPGHGIKAYHLQGRPLLQLAHGQLPQMAKVMDSHASCIYMPPALWCKGQQGCMAVTCPGIFPCQDPQSSKVAHQADAV